MTSAYDNDLFCIYCNERHIPRFNLLDNTCVLEQLHVVVVGVSELMCEMLRLVSGARLDTYPGWRDLVLFYEFYNPDTGRGHGARYAHGHQHGRFVG